MSIECSPGFVPVDVSQFGVGNRTVCRPACQYFESRDWNGYCVEPSQMTITWLFYTVIFIIAVAIALAIMKVTGRGSESAERRVPPRLPPRLYQRKDLWI